VLVSTSRHVTQGIIDVIDEKWTSEDKSLSGTSEIVANDPYELRVAGLQEGGRIWKLVSASISTADQDAHVSITPRPIQPDEEGWVRVNLSSPESRAIRWTLKFAVE
jgi:hypothetical protein